MRRHDLDPVSLVFGLLFLAIAVALLVDAPALALLRLRWLLPTLGIVVGVALLGSALRGDHETATADGDQPPSE
ncbi:MAG TPA: hypothetical protein VNU01_09820 [Egibacteraceae bacterium]|nr:hypothetical protein [Egibacteraceae bacterium]